MTVLAAVVLCCGVNCFLATLHQNLIQVFSVGSNRCAQFASNWERIGMHSCHVIVEFMNC